MQPICYHTLGLLGISLGIGLVVTIGANAVSRTYEEQRIINVLSGVLAAWLYYTTSIKLLDSENFKHL